MANQESKFESSLQARFWIGVAAVAAGALIGWLRLGQGWFPHDEGQLGLSALNVGNGLLPHRDFDEMYTGALSFLNALSFKLWGVSCHSMRWMMFCWYVPFLVCVYSIATRFVMPLGAGVATVLAASWSIPIYSAPMPSWYNLFMASVAAWGLIKFAECNAKQYLLLAGAAIGVSVCFKVSGLFVLAAALLFVLYRNQLSANQDSTFLLQQPEKAIEKEPQERSWFFAVLISVALLAASALSFVFVNKTDTMMQIIHFVIPFFALTLFVVRKEMGGVKGSFAFRARTLIADCLPLLIGCAIPIGLLAGYYGTQGAISDWLHGTFVMPGKRASAATFPFPNLYSFPPSLILACVVFLVVPNSPREISKPKSSIWVVVAICIALVLLTFTKFGFTIVFNSFRNLGPILIVGNVLTLVFRGSELNEVERQRFFIITAVAFFVSLIQFPFAFPIYFFYAAPAFLLAACGASKLQNANGKRALFILACFFIAVSLVRFQTPSPGSCLNANYVAPEFAKFQSNRCRLLVGADEVDVYKRIIDLVEANSEQGDTVFALPDAPEVAFLTDRKPFNGVMYEFFHPELYADKDKLRNGLLEKNVDLVVINEYPSFSTKISDGLRNSILSDFEIIDEIWQESGDRKHKIFTVLIRK